MTKPTLGRGFDVSGENTDPDALFRNIERRRLSATKMEQSQEFPELRTEILSRLESFAPFKTVQKSLKEHLLEQHQHETIIDPEQDSQSVVGRRLRALGGVVDAVCLHAFSEMRVSLALDDIEQALTIAERDLTAFQQTLSDAQAVCKAASVTESQIDGYLKALIDQHIAAAWFEHLQVLSRTPLQN